MLLKYCYLSTAFYSFQHVHQLIRWMRTLMIRYLQLVCKRVKPNQPKILFDWAASITDNNLSHSAFFLNPVCAALLALIFVSCGTDQICFTNELLWSRTNLLVPHTDTCMAQRSEYLPVHSQQCIWEQLLVQPRVWRRCTVLIVNQIWPLVRCECNDNVCVETDGITLLLYDPLYCVDYLTCTWRCWRCLPQSVRQLFWFLSPCGLAWNVNTVLPL